MAFIKQNTQQVVIKPASKPFYLKQLASNLTNSSSVDFDDIVEKCKARWEAVWDNPNFTPSEVLTALGTNAKSSFQTHAATVAYIGSVSEINGLPGLDAKYTYPAKPVIYHDDGTVTIQGA